LSGTRENGVGTLRFQEEDKDDYQVEIERKGEGRIEGESIHEANAARRGRRGWNRRDRSVQILRRVQDASWKTGKESQSGQEKGRRQP
jgi:hypothetical protein